MDTYHPDYIDNRVVMMKIHSKTLKKEDKNNKIE